MDAMTQLAKQMARKGDTTVAVFAAHKMSPVPMPVGRKPEATREAAEAKAREALASPMFTQAWTVGRDGVQEVQA